MGGTIGHRVYEGGVLVLTWDDEAREVIDHRTGDARPYTEDEHDEADERVAAKARVDDLEARVARIEAALWPPPPAPDPDDTDVPVWEDVDGVVPPGGLLRDVDGVIYRNVSGAPLVHPPSALPGGPAQWTHLWRPVAGGGTTPGPGDGPAPWAVDVDYSVGDEVTHNGRLWRAKLAHRSHVGWAPSTATHAVWDDLGAAPGTIGRKAVTSRGRPT